MSWWKRLLGSDDEPEGPPATLPAQPPAPDPGDDPDALRAAVAGLVRTVNAESGALPTAAVVNVRRLLDTLLEVVETSRLRPLDVYAAIAVRTTLEDYLPTTLAAYLAVDPALRDVPRASGHSPTQSLMMQVDALQTSASATLVAARDQDVDALMSQGSFLSTKFSGSDLDL